MLINKIVSITAFCLHSVSIFNAVSGSVVNLPVSDGGGGNL